jgi:hypothetical protein
MVYLKGLNKNSSLFEIIIFFRMLTFLLLFKQNLEFGLHLAEEKLYVNLLYKNQNSIFNFEFS